MFDKLGGIDYVSYDYSDSADHSDVCGHLCHHENHGQTGSGKLSIFDLVISIMIAEIAVLFLKISKADLGGTCSYRRFGCHSGRTCLYRLKNRNIRLFADGKPSVLVSRGRLHRKEMARLRYNLDDLMRA